MLDITRFPCMASHTININLKWTLVQIVEALPENTLCDSIRIPYHTPSRTLDSHSHLIRMLTSWLSFDKWRSFLSGMILQTFGMAVVSWAASSEQRGSTISINQFNQECALLCDCGVWMKSWSRDIERLKVWNKDVMLTTWNSNLNTNPWRYYTESHYANNYEPPTSSLLSLLFSIPRLPR